MKTKSISGIFAQALSLIEICNERRQYGRSDKIREIARRYQNNIRAAAIFTIRSAESTTRFSRAIYAGY